jgi:predicted amidohydrolase
VRAVAAVAAQHKMYIVVAFRQKTKDGSIYNSAILLGTDGVPLPAVHSGSLSYYKSFPVLYEKDVVPGNTGVQAWDLEGIGRVSVLICFDINFTEMWQQVAAA